MPPVLTTINPQWPFLSNVNGNVMNNAFRNIKQIVILNLYPLKIKLKYLNVIM